MEKNTQNQNSQNSSEQPPDNRKIPHPPQENPATDNNEPSQQQETPPQPQVIINNQPTPPTQAQQTESRTPHPQNPTVVYPKSPFPWHKIIYAIETIISVLLVFRIFFSIFAANETNQLVKALFVITDPLIKPFENIFPVSPVSGITVEWSIFIAMVVYSLGAFLLGKLIQVAIYRNR